jgi:hypothetical protein
MIENIVNLSNESFLNDLSANQLVASEAFNSVIVAQGDYHYFKSFFKFITLLAFLV